MALARHDPVPCRAAVTKRPRYCEVICSRFFRESIPQNSAVERDRMRVLRLIWPLVILPLFVWPSFAGAENSEGARAESAETLPDAARVQQSVNTIREALRLAGGPRDARVEQLIAAEIRRTHDLTLAALPIASFGFAMQAGAEPSAAEHSLRAHGARVQNLREQLSREHALTAGTRATLVALAEKIQSLSSEVREIAELEDPAHRTERVALLRERLTPARPHPSPTMWSMEPASESEKQRLLGKDGKAQP